MIKVAIIDDGISSGFYGICNIAYSVEVNANLVVQNVDKNSVVKDSHGTICAAIVKKYYPEVILNSVKVFSDRHKCKTEQLVKAIEWCMNNGIQVINLSLGTIEYRDFGVIRDIINKAYSKGIIIVAACSNKDVFTYPAACTNVIGVKSGELNALKEGKYIFNLYPLDGIEITACSQHALLKNGCKRKITSLCNSYAAPMITAEVCRIMSEFTNATLEEIKQKLYKGSSNCVDDFVRINNYKNIDWIRKAALIYMGKGERKFELPYAAQIKNSKEIEKMDLKQVDTLILINNVSQNYSNISSIIGKFHREKKNIVVIDDSCFWENYDVKCISENIKFWYPLIVKHFYEQSLSQKELDVPLIIIYGYDSGNLVKAVRKLTIMFGNDGYYAVGGCTKPIGVLYGLEYLPVNKDNKFKGIRDKIEVLYKVYDYDVMILGIVINEEDSSIMKKININLNPDEVVYLNYDLINETTDFNIFYKKILSRLL